jgi:hypothetical protein
MLSGIKTYLEFGSLFCGIEHSSQNSKDIIFTMLLKKRNKTLDVEHTFQETSIETHFSMLPKKQHFCLIINNDQVLTKKIDSSEVNSLKVVYNAFPNINLDDFYYEVLIQEKNQFVSICRKTYIEDLVNNYTQFGLSVIYITLGNSIISGISDFLKSQCLVTTNAKLVFEDQAISVIEKREIEETQSYNINGLEITNNYILSFSGALNTLMNHFNPSTNLDELISSQRNNFKQSRFFNVFLRFGLVFILTILLSNFFFFNYYYNEVETLQQTSQVNQTTKEKIIELNERVTKSQKMVDDMLKGRSSESSSYVNAVVQSLPKSILLSELNYQPLTKRIKKELPIMTDNNMLLISGESNDKVEFSKWLVDLGHFNWVKKVDIINYGDSKFNSLFSIKISINNDQQN